MDPNDARAMAIQKMGDLAAFKRTCVDLARKRDREMSIALWLEEFRDDLKFAFRQLRTEPAFTLVAALTLALGIGANSAIFALVDATLLRPLPYGAPDRLVTIWEKSEATARGFASPPNMLDWNSRSRTFEKIAGFTPNVGSMVMAGADGNAETVPRQWVSAGIFDVLGVKPIVGRTFTDEDERKRDRVVVLSEGLLGAPFQSRPQRGRQRGQAGRRALESCGRDAEVVRDTRTYEHVGHAAVRQHAAPRPRSLPDAGRWADETRD